MAQRAKGCTDSANQSKEARHSKTMHHLRLKPRNEELCWRQGTVCWDHSCYLVLLSLRRVLKSVPTVGSASDSSDTYTDMCVCMSVMEWDGMECYVM